ncbi:hypothetical protein AMTRI_Chr11g96910 [Amborella trichopoda]
MGGRPRLGNGQLPRRVPYRLGSCPGTTAHFGRLGLSYRQMRQKEQDRLARMDVDYQRRKKIAEFNTRREERIKAAEEQTKQKKKEKKCKVVTAEDQDKSTAEQEPSDSDNSDGQELH